MILNPQQLRFVDEMVADPSNYTKAALRAGYSPHSAKMIGHKLMKHPEVIKEISVRKGEQLSKFGLDKDRVLQELMQIAFANIKNYITEDEDGNVVVNISSIKKEHATAITEINVSGSGKNKQVKIKMADKILALEKLGKHLGMFTEKLEVSGTVTLEKLIEESYKTIDITPKPILIE